ncbi:MAG: hypothetical protein AAFW69_04025, partial [Pseudomonadota bacterium]
MFGFVGGTLLLSVPVALRIVPVFLVLAGAAWVLFSQLTDIWHIVGVVVLGLYPSFAFLVLTGIRAGLMQLGVTSAPGARSLFRMTFRLISFNF